ncbi:hypothetical protein [Paenibacillus sp.]|nr:hypothetical protein [Paenibacillus sp.]
MREFVGNCRSCESPIYCNEGFLNGIVMEDKTLLCFDCSEEPNEEKEE